MHAYATQEPPLKALALQGIFSFNVLNPHFKDTALHTMAFIHLLAQMCTYSSHSGRTPPVLL